MTCILLRNKGNKEIPTGQNWSSKLLEHTTNNWIKQYKRQLSNKYKNSKTLQPSTDFHGAILKAFERTQIFTSDSEIRAILKAIHIRSICIPQEHKESPLMPTQLKWIGPVLLTSQGRKTIHGIAKETTRTRYRLHGLVPIFRSTATPQKQ
jgi:hypothetical protein